MSHFRGLPEIFGSRKEKDSLGNILFFLNSVLLGIWAVKHTIALRNNLLVVGALVSIFIIKREFISCRLKGVLNLRSLMPIILLMMMFFWVLWHFIYMPQYPEIQAKELTSTWLRALLATLNGIAIGMLVRKNIRMLNWLWLGIFASFIALYFQYIQKILNAASLFQYDPYGYIFHLKINGILVGSMLIAGLGGLTLDLIRIAPSEKNRLQLSFCVLSVCLTLYAYVYIFDSRNGIGIAAALFIFWGCIFLYKAVINLSAGISISGVLMPVTGALLLALIFCFFLVQQSSYNTGWSTFFEDFSIGLQSDKYINWRDFNALGMPVAPSGRQVSSSTYERIALMVEGLKVISSYPFGCGVLTQPFMKMLPQVYPGVFFSGQHATHSAWIEFGIAFGVPGLLFLIGSLITSAINTIKQGARSIAPITILSLVLNIMILYLVGEVSTQHGVEILFYFLALIFALQIPNLKLYKFEGNI